MTTRPAHTVAHERATEARNYRDSFANAIASLVADGMAPSQNLIERYRFAVREAELASAAANQVARNALRVAA